MAFLDNSGDIILDAVLTDTGRYKLARGEFNISQFALGDDEIDYSLYNKTHASGSTYYDLEILQTPVLEAFTNNASSLKSKLMTVASTDLLYLPVIKLNEKKLTTKRHTSGAFLVAVNNDTENALNDNGGLTGVIKGENAQSPNTTIRLDQGLDTSDISPAMALDSNLIETQYIIELDNRLGKIVSPLLSTSFEGASPSIIPLEPNFIDDDNIASYAVDTGNTDYVSENNSTDTTAEDGDQTLAGPRGTILQLNIAASLDLNTGTYLFSRLGSTDTGSDSFQVTSAGSETVNTSYIDTTLKITGVQTGYRVDVPIRFIRKQ